MKRSKKLKALAEFEGFSNVSELLEEIVCDSVSPGICTNEGCDYTCDIEPDSNDGYCEECGTDTVASALVLAAII